MYVYVLTKCYKTFRLVGDGSATQAFAGLNLWLPIVMSLLYLGGIYSMRVVMANRKPMGLKDSMVVYNLYQTLLNLWCVIAFVQEVRALGMSIVGNPIDNSPEAYRLGFIVWVHYNNKYVEFLDTVFMALRKKDNQITFLHVYHHVLLVWAWYCATKYGTTGDCYFGAICNSFVHVLMYGYYLLALLKVNTPWKRWLTKIQLVQFCVCFAQASYVMYNNHYPAWLGGLQIFVMVNMLVLFGNFYHKSYTTAPKSRTE